MLGRNTIQSGSKQYGNNQQSQQMQTPKNYINYISFQTNPKVIQREQPREPDHVSLYSLNTQQHPQPRSGTPNGSTPINRNAYLNAPVEPRRQPPKQNPLRNTNSKEPYAPRQSQELSKNKTQSLKNSIKGNSQSSNRISNDFYQTGINAPSQIEFNTELSSPNCSSKTVDLGAISRQKSSEQQILSNEEEELKQKINYLEVIEQSLLQFEKSRQPKDLQQLNQDNRLLLLRAFEQMNRVKQANKRPINDSVTQSDNVSQDAVSIEDKSDSRTNSLRVTSEKRRYIEGFSRSKQKDKDRSRQTDNELKINERLKQQYEQQLAKFQNKKPSQLDQLTQAIQTQEQQIQKYKALNAEISGSLNPLPFFKQWKIMCEEAQGAKKTSFRIKQEIVNRKEKLKQYQSGKINKIPLKSQQTSSHQDLSKGREGSVTKAKPMMNIMKIPPSPINRPQGNSMQFSSGNRTVQESTIKMGQNRPKSINRSTTNN